MTQCQLGESCTTSSGMVCWQRLGNKSTRPVLLLHGTPFSSLVWQQIAPALARRYPVYVWDMPGYGQFEKSETQDLSLPALTHVFTELLQRWALDAPAVIAHDSGGAIALGAHLEHGIPYQSLALVDAVTLPPWGSDTY